MGTLQTGHKLTTFMNLRTDYGFKRMFGTTENKHIIIRLLNAIFDNKITITDIKYHDKEMLPDGELGKRILYDIYCTSDIIGYTETYFKPDIMVAEDPFEKGTRTHHFILEMQNEYEPPFEDRVVYYTSRPLAAQGNRGWKYALEPVISIVVSNFDFPHMSKKLVRQIGIADLESGELFSDKMRIINLSLAQMKGKDWNDCKSEIERILYLISNMDKLEKNSEAYKGKDYDDFFNAAETSSFVAEEAVAYSQSLERLKFAEDGINFARRSSYEEGKAAGHALGLSVGKAQGLAIGKAEGVAIGKAEGVAIGKAQGLAIGKAEGRNEAIRFMHRMGLDVDSIANQYNLSREEVIRIATS